MEQGAQPPSAAVTVKRDAATWISVSANVAVLVGLIFVAVQIRQNTVALRGAAYQSWLATNMDLNMAITSGDLGAVLAAGHADAKNLSEETHIPYSMECWRKDSAHARIRETRRGHDRYREGLELGQICRFQAMGTDSMTRIVAVSISEAAGSLALARRDIC